MTPRALKIKICGLTRLADAEKAIELGATHLGFIVWPGSARFISPMEAGTITKAVRARVAASGGTLDVRTVGVFVNPSPAEIKLAQDAAGFDLIQFHGNESMATVRDLALAPFFRALRPRHERELEGVAEWQSLPGFAAFLVDAAVTGQYGGTGVRADGRIAARLQAIGPTLLSGGLTPETVGEAIREVRPWGVDVASGVEAAPGIKDHQKLERFFDAIDRA
jgi:phosphoribosylanthranilate isomerase